MKLRTKGLKARDLDLDLKGSTLLIGPNGSGKSTASDALRFLALGYVPNLGKRPVDTAALMKGEEMAVALMLDDGRVIQRTLKRDADKLVQEVEVSWLKKAKTTEGGKAILGLFGAEEADAAECLDIRTLLGAKPNERASRIEQLMASAGVNIDERIAMVDRFTLQRLIGVTDERMPENTADALPMVAEPQQAVLKNTREALTGRLKESGLGEALDWANQAKRDASTGLKNRQAAQAELKKKLAGVPEPAAEVLGDLRREAGKMQRDIGGLEADHRNYKELAEARMNAEQAVQTRASAAADAQAKLNDARNQHGSKPGQLEKEIAGFGKDLSGLVDPEREECHAVSQISSWLRELQEKNKALTVPGVRSIEAERQALMSACGVLDALKASPWSEVLEITKKLLGRLPTKGNVRTIKDVKAIVTIAEKEGGATVDEAENKVDEAKGAYKDAEAERKSELKAAETAKGKIRDNEKEQKDTEAKLKLEEKADQEAYDKKAKAVRDRRVLVESNMRRTADELLEINSEISDVEAYADTTADSLAAAREVLGEMRPLGAEPTDPEVLKGELEVLEKRVKEETEKEVAFKQIKTIVDEIDRAKAKVDVWSALEFALQRARGIELSSKSGRLLTFMTDFFKAAGRSEVPFVRATTGSTIVGWKRADGLEVQAQALSGGEWCLFCAAITSAVVLIRPSELKVLLVEAGEGDPETLFQLMKGINGIANGLTATLVMTHNEHLKVEVKDWQIINVAADERVDEAPRSDKAKETKEGDGKDGSKTGGK